MTTASHFHARWLPGVEGAGPLAQLAFDVRWSWNHAADALWRQIDPDLWEATHSPLAVLQSVARDRIEALLADPKFRARIETLIAARRAAASAPAWFQRQHPEAPLSGVAYFSLEFMLSEALPIYSGGLGNVAGDQLKAADDLGVPVIGVGLLYAQGYFRQVLDAQGAQRAVLPYNDPGQLPITPVRRANGEWLRFTIEMPGEPLWLRAWRVQVGTRTLYLLDSNDAATDPVHRGITGELYGGGAETRLAQELVLGIGGWRLLELLGLAPEVCHLNEGHAAFAVLERAHAFMQRTGESFETALAATRAGNVFTTHTAVESGFDRFDPKLIERHLGEYARSKLGIPLEDLLALGRLNRADASEPFSMAMLAMRGSGAANAVSRLHGQVSRRLFAPMFPRWPLEEVPVDHVTNGVHVPSWDSAQADALWTRACGPRPWVDPSDGAPKDLGSVSDQELWEMRNGTRAALVEYSRTRLARQLRSSGASAEEVLRAGSILDPKILTLGFARRFAAYKRPNLLLKDPERLLGLLTHPTRPVQIIIAGKAHPQDAAGQALILQWTRFIRSDEARERAVFLADYDMLLTERLVQGVDLWLNTPRRPWEACGTSGMKVLVNGGLNLSELDGWWAEAYRSEVGWALGDGREHGDDAAWDAAEADALYRLLEQEVVPRFYERDADGVPAAWVARMRESMTALTPQYSSVRTVREYTERYYLPAARRHAERAANGGARAREIAARQSALERHWAEIRFEELRVETAAGQMMFEIVVHLGAADPAAVCVELCADALPGEPAERHRTMPVGPAPGRTDGYLFRAALPAVRPAGDYTARILPHFDGVAVPMELDLVLWQR